MRWTTALLTALVLCAGGASAYAGTSPSPSPSPGYSSTGTWQLLAEVNQHRRAMGLRPLAVDSRLAGIARSWAEHMVATGTLAHNDAFFSPASHRSLGMRALGENVGWNYSVREQGDAFLHSPGHRANIENGSFTVAGFAVVRGVDGRIWSVEDFGAPA